MLVAANRAPDSGREGAPPALEVSYCNEATGQAAKPRKGNRYRSFKGSDEGTWQDGEGKENGWQLGWRVTRGPEVFPAQETPQMHT